MTQQQPHHSGEPGWVETLLPLIIVGLIGAAIYSQRLAVLCWLATQHLIIDPTHHPPFQIYAGYGVDVQRIVFLLCPAVAALISAVIIGASIWRICTAPRRPR